MTGWRFVYLVSDDNERFALSLLNDFFNFLACRDFIDEPENDGGFVEFLVGTLDAKLFDFIISVADACRVDKTECYTVYDCRVFDDVASGAVNVGNDCFFIAYKPIEVCSCLRLSFR